MSYYMGDYYNQFRRRGMYRGDYYRGDPGFFSAIGGLFKKGIGALAGGIPVVGPAIKGLIGGGGGATKVAGGALPIVKGAMGKIGGAIKKHPVLSAAGAAGATAGLGGMAGAALERHLLGGRKRRRMNVYNPRALRRAVRRSLGFAKMARKVMFIQKKFKHPKRWGHMGHFPRKRKKR